MPKFILLPFNRHFRSLTTHCPPLHNPPPPRLTHSVSIQEPRFRGSKDWHDQFPHSSRTSQYGAVASLNALITWDAVRNSSFLTSTCTLKKSIQFPTTRVEAGSNTSTVTLRVGGGDEKGGLKSEAVIYGRESQTWTQERLRCQGQQKTDPSSRQRGRPTNTRP
jgi:hypothetical protein